MSVGLVVRVRFGWMAIIRGAHGIQRTSLPMPTREEAMLAIGLTQEELTNDIAHVSDLVRRLQRYFEGHTVQFPDALDYVDATPFQQQVWECVRTIPYGETRTYRWVAQQVKRISAYRAVGQAISKNPLPILVPCHRVVRSDGSLGGFGGGVEMKRRLLDLERSSAPSENSGSI